MDVTRTATMVFSKREVIQALQALYPDCLPLTHAFAGSPKSVDFSGASDRVTISVTVPVGH